MSGGAYVESMRASNDIYMTVIVPLGFLRELLHTMLHLPRMFLLPLIATEGLYFDVKLLNNDYASQILGHDKDEYVRKYIVELVGLGRDRIVNLI